MRPSFLRAATVALTLMFAACVPPAAPSSQGAVPDEAALVSTPEASYADGMSDPAAVVIALETKSLPPVCGITCAKGYHPIEFQPQATCSYGYTVTCAPNSGPEFQTCGTSCPAGYHPEEYSYGASCWIGFPGIFRDQTRCVANSGTQFSTCGTACPGGYHASEYNKEPSCSLDGITPVNNETLCDINAGASFYVCGSTCPSGYAATDHDYWPGCGSGSVFYDNRVQCQRLFNGDVTVSPQFVTVPSDQSVNVSVSWLITQATSAELRVTAPGQAESVLSTGLLGSLSYGPVRGGETHTFRLFGNGQLLDTDAVVAVPTPTGTISASPQTVVVSGTAGTTTIAWSSQNAASTAKVYVRVNGGAPSPFAAGASGTQAAPWIVAGNSYRFSLHAGDSNAAQLAAVVVIGQAAVVPTPGPWWNPARSGNALDLRPSGNNLGVTWLTYDLDGTPVWYTSWLGRTGADYSGTVNRYTWNGSSATSSVVGAMTITPATSTTGSLAYTVDGRSAVEPIEYFGFAGAPLVPPLSGVWYPPAESGWGVYFDTQGSTHSTYVTVYAPDGRPTWAHGVATGGATVVSFGLIRVTDTNLCPGCIGPTSASTATVGTMTVNTAQLGASQLLIDLNWSVWPRWGVILNRLL